MSGAIVTRYKRLRMEEAERQLMIGGTEGVSTSIAPEVSSRPPAVAGKAPVESTLQKFIMPPSILHNILCLRMLGSKMLLVDCRNFGVTQENLRQIKISNNNNFIIVRSPVRLPENQGSPADIVFPTKSSVIGFLQKYCQALLVYLGTPGRYAEIVVFDEMSTVGECSKPVHRLIDALVKWNEKTKTEMYLLQGGMNRFSKEFPDSVMTLVQPNRTVTQAQIVPTGCPSSAKEGVEEMLCYLKNHDEVIDILKKLLILKRRLVALDVLKPTLKEEMAEEEDKLSKELDKLISTDVKCPICFEVFQEEIFQCSNGHSICSNCCTTLTICPECRAPYTVKVRNRALENLMRDLVTVRCLCGDTLKLKEVRNHVAICVKKRKGDEMAELENDLGVTKEEMEKLNVKLGEVNKTISDIEMLWFSRLGGASQKWLVPEVCRKFDSYKAEKKKTIESLKSGLYLLAHCHCTQIPL